MAWPSLRAEACDWAAFWMLAAIIPWGYRGGLGQGRQGAARRSGWADGLSLIARDASAAALIAWVWLVLGAIAPGVRSLGLGVCIAWCAAVSYIDRVLLRDMGARVDVEMLRYTFDLNRIGGARWHRPFGAALLCAALALCATYVLTPFVPDFSISCLFGISCGVLPLRMWASRRGSDAHLWSLHGVPWRWVQMGLSAIGQAWSQTAPKALSAVGPGCIPPEEQYTLLHPNYPLWRTTQTWGSPRHLPVQMAKQHRPHVIYVVMESMGAMNTGCIGGVSDATPCFDAWSTQGALFTKHYAPGHSTSRSVMAALYGVLPGLRARPTLKIEHPAYLHGLPQILKKVGYRSMYMQGATLSFDNKQDYFTARGFDEVVGCEGLLERYPDAELGAWDAPHDSYLFDAHLAWVKTQHSRGQPTFSTLLTISNHDPWAIPKAYRPDDLRPDSAYAACMASGDPAVIRRRAAMLLRYADAQLGRYLDGLAQAGILQDAIVLISGDTGQQQEADQTVPQIGGFLRDSAYHVPMLLLAPSFVRTSKRFAHLTSQVDVVPTIMDVLGLEGPHHSMGQSLVRVAQHDVVHFTQPHQPAHLTVRQGDWRLNASVDGAQVALYNLVGDAHEMHDVAPAHPQRVRHLIQQIFITQPWVMRLHQQDAFCPKPGAVQAPNPASLREAVYAFAPQGLHVFTSREQLDAWLLQDDKSDAKEVTAMRQLAARILRTTLDPEDALLLVQLRLRLLYPDSFGELDWLEHEQYKYLEQAFGAAEVAQEETLLAQVQAALGNFKL